MSQQIPSIFSFGNTSDDALNLTNYVDQMYNEEAVEQIPVSLAVVSTQDQKFDSKLNANCDNMTEVGGENLRAYAYPGDDIQEIDLKTVYEAGNVYTADIAGWLVIEDTKVFDEEVIPPENPDDTPTTVQKSRYVKLVSIRNDLETIDVTAEFKTKLQAKLPMSKYQVAEITYTDIDTVEEVDDEGNTLSITIPDTLKCYFIPSGTQTNIGETIAQTRDYKDIMAGIGFPDMSKYEELALPESKSKLYAEQDCYYSISVQLAEGDYFSMYTKYSGVDLVYSAQNNSLVRHAILAVPSATEITIEYKLTNDPKYFVILQPKGRAV